jgi:hypothetical protein
VGAAPVLNPVSVSGIDAGGLKRHFKLDTQGRLEINAIQSLPIPTGASTSALQTTGNTSLSSIDSKTPALVSGRQPVDGSGVTQPISASSLPLPTGASTSALQTTGNTSLSTIATNTPTVGQKTMANSSPVVISSDQSAVSTTETRLPTALGQQAASTSLGVTLSSENVQDLSVTGQAAQTAIVNNILTATAGAAATDTTGYRSALVQVVSTGTGGTFIFEGSNDNVNFQVIPVFIQSTVTGAPITTAITASASQFGYTFPLQFRFHRIRIVTAITGGSIQAHSKFSQTSWAPGFNQIVQNTAANLLTTATIASGTVTTVSSVTAVASVTSSNAAIPLLVTDQASAAITTTTTSATFTPGSGSSYSVVIPVTVVTGTTPAMDVQIQESDDTGTNWVAIYDFPRITATGMYRSPVFPLTGNRVRYVQTITGTTPSFTRAIHRLQNSLTSYTPLRQIIDRTISMTTLNSVTPSLTTGMAKNVQCVVNIGTATTPATLQIEGSDDNGATWYAVGATFSPAASSTTQTTVLNIQAQLLRVRVTVAGTLVVAGYTVLKAF